MDDSATLAALTTTDPDDAAALAQRVRQSIFRHFLEHAVPPVVEQLMSEFHLTRAQAVGVLRELSEVRAIALVKGTARILMAFPFSAVATPFVVHARGARYYANCSWDAIAFHAMLGLDAVRIASFCHHCARSITIEFEGGRTSLVDPQGTIVYLGLRPNQWWEDIITTCSNTMVFFCLPDHRDASDVSTSADLTASLTPDQIHQLGTPLYTDRLKIDYARPGRDELNAHFAGLGFSGPYWQI